MSDVAEAVQKLREYAGELDTLSGNLADLERQLEPVAEQVRAFTDDYELGLYQQSIEDDAYKLPSEALREKLARRALPPDLHGRHAAMVASRDRMRKRIGDLKLLVEAQRSILSALKSEQDATSGVQPAWSRPQATG